MVGTSTRRFERSSDCASATVVIIRIAERELIIERLPEIPPSLRTTLQPGKRLRSE
jgi:hypothetical protein